jgi:hypothetical protein
VVLRLPANAAPDSRLAKTDTYIIFKSFPFS